MEYVHRHILHPNCVQNAKNPVQKLETKSAPIGALDWCSLRVHSSHVTDAVLCCIMPGFQHVADTRKNRLSAAGNLIQFVLRQFIQYFLGSLYVILWLVLFALVFHRLTPTGTVIEYEKRP